MGERSLLQAQCRRLKFEIVSKNDVGNVLRLELKGKNDVEMTRNGQGEEDSSFDAVWRLQHLQYLTIRSVSHSVLPWGIGNGALGNSLTDLCIIGCKRLTELPADIGKLQNLRSLTIRNCTALTALPAEIHHLKRLRSLNLLFCTNLRLPAEVGCLEGLEELNVAGVSYLPQEVSQLHKSLRTLQIRQLCTASCVPSWIGKLSSLESLTLSGWSTITSLPDEIGDLTRLSTLEIDGCPSLKTIPRSVWNLPNLSFLKISDCSLLQSIIPRETTAAMAAPAASGGTLGAKNLKTLILNSLGSVRQLPDELGSLQNLASLKIFCCPVLEELPPTILRLGNLILLEVSVCLALKRLPTDFQSLNKLQTLSLNMCPKLDSIENLPIHLECLRLKNLSSLQTLPSQIGDLADLTTLIIGDCHSLVELPSQIGRLEKNLSYLDVAHCGALQEIPVELANLANLQTLRICSCQGIKSMPPSLRSLTALEDLKVSRCNKLASLPADLDQLPKLQKVDLSYLQRDAVFGLFDHKWKEDCVLKDLSLEGCRVRDDFFDKVLANLPKKNLISLDLDDTGITSLDGFFPKYGGGDYLLPRGIVDLDLSNSPLLDSFSANNNPNSNKYHHRNCLERLVKLYPCLEYIGTSNDDDNEESSFSLKTHFMLRFNESGRVLLRDDIKPPIPMSLWPRVLSRVQNVVRHVGRNDSKCMEASILFEFLHGPVILNHR